MSQLLTRCKAALGGREPDYTIFVPGRLEVLGKHTDYAGGRSLLATLERGFVFQAAGRADDSVTVVAAETGERFPGPTPAVAWGRYAQLVVDRADRDFTLRHGADIVFASNLPMAAGMSSSTALVVGVFLCLAAVNDLHRHFSSAEDLAVYLAGVETGVGTHGGSEDHTALLCCRPESLSVYSFRPTRFEGAVSLPADTVFALAASGVSAAKAGAAQEPYNHLAATAAAAAAAWRAASGDPAPHLGAVGDREQLLRLVAGDAALRDRVEHFFTESVDLIPAAVAALEAGDLSRFGDLVAASAEAADRLLHNQVPETLFLARAALDAGARAASPFGAGFGGSVWALVDKSAAPAMLADWESRYRQEFPHRHGTFFLSGAGPAAGRNRTGSYGAAACWRLHPLIGSRGTVAPSKKN